MVVKIFDDFYNIFLRHDIYHVLYESVKVDL